MLILQIIFLPLFKINKKSEFNAICTESLHLLHKKNSYQNPKILHGLRTFPVKPLKKNIIHGITNPSPRCK